MRDDLTLTLEEELLESMTIKGSETGRYIKTLKTGHETDCQTISRAAIAQVNSLPIDDLELEDRLKRAYERAAMKAIMGNG